MSPRATYHHGDLRAALIDAADQLIAEGGIETFSLRAAAQRAGVSPAAPAHHFGSVKGLLTQVALLAYARAGDYLDSVHDTPDPAHNVRALSLAFVRFAVENPGHFRLMFRGDLVDRDDPRYREFSHRPGLRLGRAVATYHGHRHIDMNRFEDAAEMLGGIAAMHGLAYLVLEGKALRFFKGAQAESFLTDELPRVLEQIYPALPPPALPVL
ncbi:TetR/AcrR family transcriptional regulator [Acidipila sp. EB88]|uniref:TetR/AcrR family transcriptional regulator n=1 Tax=Acidipila sp. EB88 TaxID=2305226 RepID=UPI00131520FA|nr:TetR/AcrR family transcriptional regulator [Acidipila sp. EB88]